MNKIDKETVEAQVQKMHRLYLQLAKEIFAQSEHLAKQNVREINGVKHLPLNDYVLRLRSTRHRIISELEKVSQLH